VKTDLREIEEKWTRKWIQDKVFEADPDKSRPKVFVTFPFPYMNGPLHLGHAFTSTRCDVYARYKRMQGYNVLFPWAWHLTGEPIAGAAERIRKGDESQIRIFREIDKVPEEELEKFVDPEYLARYYIRESKKALMRLGHSIDWRREFTTTTLNPAFSRYIEWQYLTLREKGYVRKGTHPVIWCPNDRSPTGDHDRLRGEGATPVEYTLLKFKYEDAYLPAATLRPETIYGVTNMWVNPESRLVKARVEGETWIVSQEAAEKLREQFEKVEELEKLKGEELVGKKCIHPLSREEVLILPASFVDPDSASGIVMSVPSHAPYDHAALEDLRKNPAILEEYGLDPEEVRALEPISLIKAPSYGEHPAVEICREMGIESQEDPRLKEATETIYRAEFYKGVLKENTGKYAGMRVSEVKKTLIKDFTELGIASRMYETSEEVVCRCSTRCLVKILRDQWFLAYSDEDWKDRVREALADMRILPEEARGNFEYTIGWLEDKACTRRTGLGTPLPWDREWIVETLSDSTVYMAFYAIAKYVNAGQVKAEHLTKEVLDYLLLGEGDAGKLAQRHGVEEELLKEIRAEVDYWMPVDLRVSGKDLIPNHLTFFLFQHVALFPREKWPRAIGVNGYVRVEGEKMSKSKGNFITLRDLLQRYGSDVARAALLYSAEGLRDPDWRTKNVRDMEGRLRAFASLINGLASEPMREGEVKPVDQWLLSRMQGHIERATQAFENLETRSAFQAGFFDVWKDVRWYMRRGRPHRRVMARVLRQWIRLVAPYIPALSEELWRTLGGEGYVSLASWPKPDKSLVSPEAEAMENLVKQTMEDVENILKVTGAKPEKLFLYTSPGWKWRALELVSELKAEGSSGADVLKKAMQVEGIRVHGKEAVNYISALMREPRLETPVKIDERTVLEKAKEFFQEEFGCPVEVYSAEDAAHDPLNKRRQAKPLKPAIYVEGA
jgi:leucyl-tRNA synthetase